MEFQLNNASQSDIQETKMLSPEVNKIVNKFQNAITYILQENNANLYKDENSFLPIQANNITIRDDEQFASHQYSIEKLPLNTVITKLADSQSANRYKSHRRSPKLCRVCFKSVIDLRRHLKQCHKELNSLEIVKIVAESKPFRRDLKKYPSRAIRNVLLCPHINESGKVCNRPIVEYK